MTLEPSIISKINSMRSQKLFPKTGRCRVKDCREPYSRESGGRKGMCKAHYRGIREWVKNGEMTWDRIDKEFPMCGPRDPLPMPEAKLSEVEFQNHLVHYIQEEGHGAWVLDPTRQRGVPDLLIVTKDGRVLFRELKSMSGVIEDKQKVLMDSMKKHGNDVDVWRPEDWDSERIRKELG